MRAECAPGWANRNSLWINTGVLNKPHGRAARPQRRGKTTLLRILVGQEFPSAGSVQVLGATPAENDGVLRRMVFIREDQAYPDLMVGHALRAASWFYPQWSGDLADYAAHPRTVLLSTHLIDEAAGLLERVIVIDHGRIVLDAATDDLRGVATTVSGPVLAVRDLPPGARSGTGGRSRRRSRW